MTIRYINSNGILLLDFDKVCERRG